MMVPLSQEAQLLANDSANHPDPDILTAEIIEELQAALEELQAISDDLAQIPGAREGVQDG